MQINWKYRHIIPEKKLNQSLGTTHSIKESRWNIIHIKPICTNAYNIIYIYAYVICMYSVYI